MIDEAVLNNVRDRIENPRQWNLSPDDKWRMTVMLDEVCRLREAVDMLEGNYCRLSEQHLKAMEVLAHVENYNERYMDGNEIDLCPESNCPGCPAYRGNAEPSCSYQREYQILKEGI